MNVHDCPRGIGTQFHILETGDNRKDIGIMRGAQLLAENSQSPICAFESSTCPCTTACGNAWLIHH